MRVFKSPLLSSDWLLRVTGSNFLASNIWESELLWAGPGPTNRGSGGLGAGPRLDEVAVSRARVGVAWAPSRLLCSQSGCGLVAGSRGAAPQRWD